VGPKGCTLVTAEDGRVVNVEHRDLDIMRWAVTVVDAGKAARGDDVLEVASTALSRTWKENSEMPLAVRLEIAGATKAHRELLANPERWRSELRSIATDVSGGSVWLEKIRFGTKDTTGLSGPAASSEALVELMGSIDGLSNNEELVRAAIEALSDLNEKLPHELKSGDEAIRLDDPETVKRAAEGVRQYLLDRILSHGSEL
jgi:hypothetical protein